MAKLIWRTVRDADDKDNFAYCGRVDDYGNYTEKCSAYCPEEMCKTCRYVTGNVIEEEREEE